MNKKKRPGRSRLSRRNISNDSPNAHSTIPFIDYQQIFRVITSVLAGADIRTATACVYYNVIGAYLLRSFYRIQAQPIVGAAFYKVDDLANIACSFAKIDGDVVTTSPSTGAFHCWIKSGNNIIDFMAPVFREALQRAGFSNQCARKMFQKNLANMSSSPCDLLTEGDFYLQQDLNLNSQLLQSFLAVPMNQDLMNICEDWYRKPPVVIVGRYEMGNERARIIKMQLSTMEITGAW